MRRITLLAVFFAVAFHLEAQNPDFPHGGFENCWKFFTNPIKGEVGPTGPKTDY
jgi:hypothetical protein